MSKLNERYIMKDDIVVDGDTVQRLGINAAYDFEHWADPDDAAEAIFGLSPEQAKTVRAYTPE